MALGMTLDHPGICRREVNVSKVSRHRLAGPNGLEEINWTFYEDKLEIFWALAFRKMNQRSRFTNSLIQDE